MATEGGRIRWSEEEKAKIVDRVFSMRQNDPESSLTSIIQRAQQQLPEERRRNIPSVKSIPWLAEAIKRRFAELRKAEQEIKSLKMAATTAQNNSEMLKARLNAMLEEAKSSALEEADVETLLVVLIEKLTAPNEALHGLIRRIEALEQKVNRKPLPPSKIAAPAKKLPTILVVGMLGQQASRLRAQFQNAANLLFFAAGTTQSVPKADAAVINAKFIPHKTQEFIQSQFKGKVYLTSGGISSVVDTIEKILKGQS
jgi:hypothetical protein